MNHEYPKHFARFYDCIYQQLRDGVDNNFFMKKIKETEGKILEIGTGTGRFFKHALCNGADIYGIDISKEMLQILKTKISNNQHHRVSVQNMVNFSFNHCFDLIVAPFRVFMHLPEVKQQLTALNNIYQHLVAGGQFIFDVFNPDLKQLLEGLDNKTDFEGEYAPGKKLKRRVWTQPDRINQLINIRFLLEWDKNDHIAHEEWKLSLRYFFRYELEHLMSLSDFSNYQIFGDYHENSLSNDSKEFVVVCQK